VREFVERLVKRMPCDPYEGDVYEVVERLEREGTTVIRARCIGPVGADGPFLTDHPPIDLSVVLTFSGDRPNAADVQARDSIVRSLFDCRDLSSTGVGTTVSNCGDGGALFFAITCDDETLARERIEIACKRFLPGIPFEIIRRMHRA
jgi:hypothetical protein